jgi:hypothetical protein
LVENCSGAITPAHALLTGVVQTTPGLQQYYQRRGHANRRGKIVGKHSRPPPATPPNKQAGVENKRRGPTFALDGRENRQRRSGVCQNDWDSIVGSASQQIVPTLWTDRWIGAAPATAVVRRRAAAAQFCARHPARACAPLFAGGRARGEAPKKTDFSCSEKTGCGALVMQRGRSLGWT